MEVGDALVNSGWNTELPGAIEVNELPVALDK